MPWILLAAWAGLNLAGTASAPGRERLPAEWPPRPDFKHPVDYVFWPIQPQHW